MVHGDAKVGDAKFWDAELSDFMLGRSLGAGTTAKVYDAVHLRTRRHVAIKMLEASEASPQVRERFQREARILSSVKSDHVAKILGFGFAYSQPFLVLERLDGETLESRLRRDGPVPVDEAMMLLWQLMLGASDCHTAGVVHRDIKPSNIFLHRVGGIAITKLIDFGLARLRELTVQGPGLTETNHVIGSMGYMAPEQFEDARKVGFPADVYAIGIVAFRTLTGRLPFMSKSLLAAVKMKRNEAVPLLSSIEGMPKDATLDAFIARATDTDPAKRFPSAREMVDEWTAVALSLDDTAPGNALYKENDEDEQTVRRARR